jgi:Pin2-interacting protein X1
MPGQFPLSILAGSNFWVESFKEMMSRDPQNKHWVDDTGRFGYKMLERMGWSSGAGLGSDGKGMKSFLRVSKKGDNSGTL